MNCTSLAQVQTYHILLTGFALPPGRLDIGCQKPLLAKPEAFRHTSGSLVILPRLVCLYPLSCHRKQVICPNFVLRQYGSTIILIKRDMVACTVVVAERVSKRSHQPNAVQLTVERLTACPPPPVIVADVDDEKLLFTGLPVTRRGKHAAAAAAAADGGESDENDEQTLRSFVQTAAGAEILHVTYSTQRDDAVITFHTTPG